jgi:hypothetical protein
MFQAQTPAERCGRILNISVRDKQNHPKIIIE